MPASSFTTHLSAIKPAAAHQHPLRHRAYFSSTMRCERPRIAETGVTVQRVVRWYRLGLTPEEIADHIGHLSLAQVRAALSYYHANRQQTDAEIAADHREAELAALNSSRRENVSSRQIHCFLDRESENVPQY